MSDSVRFEVVPLEALRVKTDEVLVLRLPEDWTPDRIDQMLRTLEDAGLDGRVLIVANPIELAVIERGASAARSAT